MKSELKKYDNINADDAQFISDIKSIVYAAKQKAYQAADLFQVAANWLIGKELSSRSSMVESAPNMVNES